MSLSEVRFLFSLDESGVVGPQRKKREKEVWVPIFLLRKRTRPLLWTILLSSQDTQLSSFFSFFPGP